HVEMVGHQAVGQQAHGDSGAGPTEERGEGGVVVVEVKNLGPSVTAVDGVVAIAAARSSGSPWHGPRMARTKLPGKKNPECPGLPPGGDASPGSRSTSATWRKWAPREGDCPSPFRTTTCTGLTDGSEPLAPLGDTAIGLGKTGEYCENSRTKP